MEYVYELNLPSSDEIFLDSFEGFNDEDKFYNYEYHNDIHKILKPEFTRFLNINWDTILYFKKDDRVGQIHTDISYESIQTHGLKESMYPFGINWIWGGDGLFEYWKYSDVLIDKCTNGSDNNGKGAVTLFKEKSPPFASYYMKKNKVYLVYGGLPHRATGYAGRKLISLRKNNFTKVPWNMLIKLFNPYIIKNNL